MGTLSITLTLWELWWNRRGSVEYLITILLRTHQKRNHCQWLRWKRTQRRYIHVHVPSISIYQCLLVPYFDVPWSTYQVALNAAAALQKSLENQSKFQPTFTGSEETRPSFSGNRMASSNSLLANLKGKRIEIANASKPPPRHQLSNAPAVLSDDKYAHLLQRIQKFIRCKAAAGKAPSTRELLNAFKDVPDSDAAVFRNLLKSVASINNGHWTLKK